MLCADENLFPWIDICAIQINKYYIIIIIVVIIIIIIIIIIIFIIIIIIISLCETFKKTFGRTFY